MGHNALGAGQVVDQGARLCDKALESHRLWELDGWKYLAPAAQAGTLHFIGLLSDGGVHSRYDQLLLLLTGVRARRRPALLASISCFANAEQAHTASQLLTRLEAPRTLSTAVCFPHSSMSALSSWLWGRRPSAGPSACACTA